MMKKMSIKWKATPLFLGSAHMKPEHLNYKECTGI